MKFSPKSLLVATFIVALVCAVAVVSFNRGHASGVEAGYVRGIEAERQAQEEELQRAWIEFNKHRMKPGDWIKKRENDWWKNQ